MSPKIARKEVKRYVPPVTRLKSAKFREAEMSKQRRAQQLLEACRRRKKNSSTIQTALEQTPLQVQVEPKPLLEININAAINRRKHLALKQKVAKNRRCERNGRRKKLFFSRKVCLKPSARWELPTIRQTMHRIGTYALSRSPARDTKAAGIRRRPHKKQKAASEVSTIRNLVKKTDVYRKLTALKQNPTKRKKNNCTPGPNKRRKLPIIEVRSYRSALSEMELENKATLLLGQEEQNALSFQSIPNTQDNPNEDGSELKKQKLAPAEMTTSEGKILPQMSQQQNTLCDGPAEQPARVSRTESSEFMLRAESDNFTRVQNKEQLIKQWLHESEMPSPKTVLCSKKCYRSRIPVQTSPQQDNQKEVDQVQVQGKTRGEPQILICTCRSKKTMDIGSVESVSETENDPEGETPSNMTNSTEEASATNGLPDVLRKGGDLLQPNENAEPFAATGTHDSGDSAVFLQQASRMTSVGAGTHDGGLPNDGFKRFMRNIYKFFMD